jgi:hypothetical protein
MWSAGKSRPSFGRSRAHNVRSALEAIDRNEEFIKMTLAVMMTPE